MENYEKGEISREESVINFGVTLDTNVVRMQVNNGSKIKNLMGFALKKFESPEQKQLTWNAQGPAVAKAISCAEIMKRKVKNLHQITQIVYQTIDEFWEPKMEGLDRLKVSRKIPAISILLSKDCLDDSLPGYQPPGSFDAFWNKGISDPNTSRSKSRAQVKEPSSKDKNAEASSNLAPPSMMKPKKRKKHDKEDRKKPGGESSSKTKKTSSVPHVDITDEKQTFKETDPGKTKKTGSIPDVDIADEKQTSKEIDNASEMNE